MKKKVNKTKVVEKEVKVKPMNKKQIIQYMSEKTNLDKETVQVFLDDFMLLAYKECKDPKGFTIPGLGKLLLKDRKARMGRNPRTGEAVKIKAKKVLKFRLSKIAKNAILGEPEKKTVVKKAVKKIKK